MSLIRHRIAIDRNSFFFFDIPDTNNGEEKAEIIRFGSKYVVMCAFMEKMVNMFASTIFVFYFYAALNPLDVITFDKILQVFLSFH